MLFHRSAVEAVAAKGYAVGRCPLLDALLNSDNVLAFFGDHFFTVETPLINSIESEIHQRLRNVAGLFSLDVVLEDFAARRRLEVLARQAQRFHCLDRARAVELLLDGGHQFMVIQIDLEDAHYCVVPVEIASRVLRIFLEAIIVIRLIYVVARVGREGDLRHEAVLVARAGNRIRR